MNNILAAQVLRNNLNTISDGAVKTAHEYLGLSVEEYNYWILGKRRN